MRESVAERVGVATLGDVGQRADRLQRPAIAIADRSADAWRSGPHPQVLLNLIFNAMDAMAEIPEQDRRILLTTSMSEASAVEIGVRDQGHGIQPAQRDRIFDSFFTTKAHGMGLGLSIARSLVDAHGGRIRVDNNIDGGATFRFTLPAPDWMQSNRGVEAMPLADTNVPVVHVVDDDASVRSALARVLRFGGFDVRQYASAAEFLVADHDNQPYCLVLDVGLPGMEGEALQAALATPAEDHSRVNQ